jgi:hypothetical protein
VLQRLPTLALALRHLTRLHLEECLLPDCRLADMHLGSLQQLAVRKCVLQAHYFEVIGAAVQRSTSLAELDLRQSGMQQSPSTIRGILAAVSKSPVWHVMVSADVPGPVTVAVDEFNAKHAGRKTALLDAQVML